MSQEVSYICVGRSFVRRLSSEAQAQDVLGRQVDALLLVLDSAQGTLIDGQAGLIMAPRNMLGAFPGPGRADLMTLIPLPGLTLRDKSSAAAVDMHLVGRTLYVHIIEMGPIPDGSLNDVPVISYRAIEATLLSVAKSMQLRKELGPELLFVHARMAMLNLLRRQVSAQLSYLNGLFEAAQIESLLDLADDRLIKLRKSRVAFSHMRLYGEAIPGKDDEDALGVLTSSLSGIDSLAIVATSLQTLALSQSSLRQSDEASLRDAAHAKRDFVYLQWGATLVLPTLWLGLLGTNVIPDVVLGITIPSTAAFVIALVGTVSAALSGYLAVSIMAHRHLDH